MHGQVIVLGGVFDHLHESLVGGGSEIGGCSVRPVSRLQQALDDRLEEGRQRRRWRIAAVVPSRLVVSGFRQAVRKKVVMLKRKMKTKRKNKVMKIGRKTTR